MVFFLHVEQYEVLKVEMAKVKEEFQEYERLDIKHQESVKFFKEQVRFLLNRATLTPAF